MSKPHKSSALFLQMLGIMLLVGAVALGIGDSPAFRTSIACGFFGLVFFVWGRRDAKKNEEGHSTDRWDMRKERR